MIGMVQGECTERGDETENRLPLAFRLLVEFCREHDLVREKSARTRGQKASRLSSTPNFKKDKN